jgi:N-succinyldiaminopimelate aminotransferase
VTALAQRCGALNLGQGFPDTDGPDWLLAAAREAIGAGANQYPPLAGVPELRLAISRQRAERYQTAYCPDSEVAVTTGATEAVAAALLGLCEPGDEMVLFEPYYDAYAAAIAMAGAVRRPVLLRPGRDGVFGFDPAELRAAVTPRTRLLLLNSPHNPTGKVFTRSELETIAALCRRHDLVALTDEVYEYLAYDGAAHVPLASLPGMRERTLAVSSAGKDLQRHRLEDRLGVRSRTADQGPAGGQAVPDVRWRHAVPAGGRGRHRAGRSMVRGAAGQPAPAP